MFILLQQFDLDLHIVKPIDAVDVLVKMRSLSNLLKAFEAASFSLLKFSPATQQISAELVWENTRRLTAET